jgi:formylglycine-generating enzyme required for sulfatase activity
MISLRTEMKKLRIILALACSFTASTLALAQSKAAPRAAGSVFRDCPDCPEMVVIPAGSFTMGSSAEEKSWAAGHGVGKALVCGVAEIARKEGYHMIRLDVLA